MIHSNARSATSDDRPSDERGALGKPRQSSAEAAPTTLSIIGAIVSQTALIGGLLYYFGWARAQAFFGYFGLDGRILGFSVSEYQVISVGAALQLFVRLNLVALALLGIHHFIARRMLMMLPGSRFRAVGQSLITAIQAVGAMLGIAAIGGVLNLSLLYWLAPPFTSPLLLVTSVALLSYGTHMRSKYLTITVATTPLPYPRIVILILLMLGLSCTAWATGLYAVQTGERAAILTAANLGSRPAVVLYSTDRVAVNGPGVDVAEIVQAGSKYRYQYTGLRLLSQAADTYVLLPMYWEVGRDRVLIFRNDDSIRVDVSVG